GDQGLLPETRPELPVVEQKEVKPVDAGGKIENMRDMEREHILKTLAEVNGSRKLAVERLGISERNLRYKLKQYREEGFLQD
ncbi:MAG: helix-turn-helix domain-containing protein, partial [Azovibrio sp.]